MQHSANAKDLIQASRPGFPQGLKVRIAGFSPRARASPRAMPREGYRPRSRKGNLLASLIFLSFEKRCVLRAGPTRSLPSPSQVLVVMKDNGSHAAAKKMLSEIGYLGASRAVSPRAPPRRVAAFFYPG
jgi:hypothetical protein